MQGFIGLHRKLMKNPVWNDPNHLKLWIYCLFKATHTDYEQIVGDQVIQLKRGQFVTGRKALTEDMNYGVKPKQRLSEKTWERYLKLLENCQMLTIEVTNKYSVVTIVNYEVYQSNDNEVDQQSDQQMTSKRPADDQQMTTNKNNKNNKNIKKEKEVSPKQVYDENSEPYIIAQFFVKEIRKNFSEFKTPNMQKWSDDIRKIIQIDGKDKKRICEIIRFVQADEFWFKNCLSPSTLRKKFPEFEVKFLAKPKTNQPKPSVPYYPKGDSENERINEQDVKEHGHVRLYK